MIRTIRDAGSCTCRRPSFTTFMIWAGLFADNQAVMACGISPRTGKYFNKKVASQTISGQVAFHSFLGLE